MNGQKRSHNFLNNVAARELKMPPLADHQHRVNGPQMQHRNMIIATSADDGGDVVKPEEARFRIPDPHQRSSDDRWRVDQKRNKSAINLRPVRLSFRAVPESDRHKILQRNEPKSAQRHEVVEVESLFVVQQRDVEELVGEFSHFETGSAH